jgi:hypothetical protein
MSIATEYHDILKKIAAWPPDRKVSLANDILGTIRTDQPTARPKRNTLARALGLARTQSPPPDDAEVARILDERRMEKYGR